MSITTDLKTYADTALAQSKQAAAKAGDFVGSARGNVSGLTDRAADTFADLRQQATTSLNLDAVRAAVEPYVAQAKGYTTAVTDRAESLFATVSSDPRVARVITTATTLTAPVVEVVQERVVTPVLSLTRRGADATSDAASQVKAEAASAEASVAGTPAPAARARKSPAKKATPSV